MTFNDIKIFKGILRTSGKPEDTGLWVWWPFTRPAYWDLLTCTFSLQRNFMKHAEARRNCSAAHSWMRAWHI